MNHSRTVYVACAPGFSLSGFQSKVGRLGPESALASPVPNPWVRGFRMNRTKLAFSIAATAMVLAALSLVPVAEAGSLKAQVFLVQVPIPTKLTEKALLGFG